MATLLIFPSALGEPSASPFCVKAICLARLAGRDVQLKPIMNPSKTPMKKLPVLLDDGQQVADTEAIAAHLGLSLEGYSPQEQALGHAVMRMVEEHTYFILLRERWQNPSHWSLVRDSFFATISPVVRPALSGLVRRGVVKSLNGQGVGRMSEAFLRERVAADLDAVLAHVETGFILGDAPSVVDCSVGPMLATIAAMPETSFLRQELAARPALEAYIARVRTALYPAA